MSIREVIKKFLLYKRNSWKFTDYFIEMKNTIEFGEGPIEEKKDFNYACIRDYNGFCIYIPENYLDIILDDKNYCSKDYGLINVSELMRHKVKRDITGQTYSKTTPPAVKLKIIEYINIEKVLIYLVYAVDLDYDDKLYNDLLNYAAIKEPY